MKAWLTELWDIRGVTWAETRSKARAASIRAARDAGFRVQFTARIAVRRAPEFDGDFRAGTCFTPEYAATIVQARAAEREARSHAVAWDDLCT